MLTVNVDILCDLSRDLCLSMRLKSNDNLEMMRLLSLCHLMIKIFDYRKVKMKLDDDKCDDDDDENESELEMISKRNKLI